MVDRYHHGDLRAALLAAAIAEVEAVGHADLSLRVLAQRLGVSAAAPYRHFADRDTLLRAVAAEGFVALGTAARDAMAQAHGLPPHERSRAGARSYLRFAGTRPKLFLLMFGTDLLTARDDSPAGLAEPATAAFEQMRGRVAAACPGASPDEIAARAVAYWSTLHGFATLRAEGRLWRFMQEGLSETAMEEALIDAAVAGFNVPPDPSRSPG